jgi:hypothetical protein
MDIKDITSKNLMNKYNNFELDFEGSEEEGYTIFLNIYTAS